MLPVVLGQAGRTKSRVSYLRRRDGHDAIRLSAVPFSHGVRSVVVGRMTDRPVKIPGRIGEKAGVR